MGISQKYVLGICENKDIDRIGYLMNVVGNKISDENLFVVDSLDVIKDHIDKRGFIVSVSYEEEIIAFLMVRFPDDDKDNLGLDIDLSKEELKYVAHIESVCVEPGHWGNGLQRKMLVYAEEILVAKDTKYIMGTVSPENGYSLNNFLEASYEIKRIKKKYNNYERAILLKKL